MPRKKLSFEDISPINEKQESTKNSKKALINKIEEMLLEIDNKKE